MCADEIAPRMEFLRDTVIQQNYEEKTIVSVDVADRKLLGDLDAVYGGRIFLAIDHHESRQEFAKDTLVDSDAAAACELIFQIAEEMNAQLDGE
ncbi:DHH family phosphoesterase, partial [[Eubacterium] siraeum]|nr:DHH family phosphoesterase [[Eubacterium] siraeum]